MKFGFCIALAIVCSIPVSTEAQSVFLGRYPARHYSAARELQGGREFHAIHEDHRGFLWFLSPALLSRYDGRDIRQIPLISEDPTKPITRCVEDSSGNLWLQVGYPHEGALFRVENTLRVREAIVGRLTKADGLPSDTIHSLLYDSHHRLWIGTNAGLVRWDTPGPVVLTQEDGLLDNGITAMHEDRSGTIWFASRRGLTSLRGREFRRHPLHSSLSLTITGMVDDMSGALWLWGGKALHGLARVYRFSGGVLREETLNSPASLKGTFQIMVDPSGILWIATVSGLIRLSDSDTLLIRSTNGLLDDVCLSVRQDREGHLWVGHVNGITKIITTQIRIYGRNEGLPSDVVRRFYVDSKNGRWFSTSDGIARISGSTVHVLNPRDGLGSGYFDSIIEDRRGKIWLATTDGVLRIAQSDALVWVEARVRFGSAREENICFSLDLDLEGDLWVTLHRGVARIRYVNGDYRVRKFTVPGLEQVLGQAHDRDGGHWFTTASAGLFHLRDGTFQRWTTSDGLPTNELQCVTLDEGGAVWVGSLRQSVFILRNFEQIKQLQMPDGNSLGVVLSITADRSGFVWIGTATGLYRVDRSSMSVQRFTQQHGLIEDAVHCVAVGDKLLCSSNSGAMEINALGIALSTVPPPIHIVGFYADTSIIVPTPHTTLSYSQRDVRFEFTAPSFLGEATVQYTWMLEGFEKEWSPPSAFPVVRYTNLNAGAYRFLVHSINRDGLMSIEPAVVEFVIRHPFWTTWWFRISNVLVLIALGALGYRYIIRRKMRRQEASLERLRMLEQERSRIAQDMHDYVGSNLTKIALFGDIVSRELGERDEALLQRAAQISRTARETIEAIEEIIWAINPHYDSLSHLVHQMRRFAEDILEARQLHFDLIVPNVVKDRPLSPDFRRNVYLLFRESVHNLVKNASATRATIEIHVNEQRIEFTVNDNGVGFDVEQLERLGMGLGGMKRRAEAVGGSISITSDKGTGTRVYFEAGFVE